MRAFLLGRLGVSWGGMVARTHMASRGGEMIARCRLFYLFIFFIQWKPTDTWPRARSGRAQLVLLPPLADSLPLSFFFFFFTSGPRTGK